MDVINTSIVFFLFYEEKIEKEIGKMHKSIFTKGNSTMNTFRSQMRDICNNIGFVVKVFIFSSATEI